MINSESTKQNTSAARYESGGWIVVPAGLLALAFFELGRRGYLPAEVAGAGLFLSLLAGLLLAWRGGIPLPHFLRRKGRR